MLTGTCIQSTELLNGTFFEKAIVFITEHGDNGAVGFIINRMFPRRFNELQAFSQCPPLPLYEGGPVDTEHLFFIHRRSDVITGGKPVTGNMYTGGDFTQAVKLIENKTITEKDIKLFIGYCGWDYQELEAEIAEGSWAILQEVTPF
jgi:putative transcriptional regulator